MRRVVIILAALAMAGAVADLWQGHAHERTCPTTLEYDGMSYAVLEVTDELVSRDELGVGTERGCGHDGLWAEEVSVSRIAGIDPRIALVTPVAAHAVYVAEGVTVWELPSEVAELVVQKPRDDVAGRPTTPVPGRGSLGTDACDDGTRFGRPGLCRRLVRSVNVRVDDSAGRS